MADSPKTLRKSCDFCYQRRMKCDRSKPCCSHCIIYDADCTYKAPSRKAGQKKLQQLAVVNRRDRLQHLETLVEQLNERVRIAESHNKTEVRTEQDDETPTSIAPLSIMEASNGFSTYRDDSRNLTTAITDSGSLLSGPTVRRSTYTHHSMPVSMLLPPLDSVLPIVEIFLKRYNAAVPLFDTGTLLRMVHRFYSLPSAQQSPIEWAAIHVVLALAYRNGLVGSSNTHSSVAYLNKAESVLSIVFLGDTQLLNIQILIGMVLLLQAMPDLTQPLILIATTMRLAHKIRLHDRTASAHLDTATARQRAHVFWIAYILDKDLSMRSKQPSIQLDDDIDLDLPTSEILEHQINYVSFNEACTAPGTKLLRMGRSR